jgi:hypothetical protein
MRRLVAGLAIAGGVMMLAPAGASAEVYYPWCAAYGGGRDGIDAVVCSFETRRQCLETVRGIGGDCVENPAPPPRAPRPLKRQRPPIDR